MDLRFPHFTQSNKTFTLVDCDVTYVYVISRPTTKKNYT